MSEDEEWECEDSLYSGDSVNVAMVSMIKRGGSQRYGCDELFFCCCLVAV